MLWQSTSMCVIMNQLFSLTLRSECQRRQCLMQTTKC
uniref:Uncharacterized protein n=1 Tax=Setaria italica TaxID=4555 RepID=K3ZPL4_SETIT